MIYLKMSGGDGELRSLLILEPGNLERLKAGLPLKTPDGTVWLGYTPDASWLTDEILKLGEGLDPGKLTWLIEESQKRAEVVDRADHPHIDLLKRGKMQ